VQQVVKVFKEQQGQVEDPKEFKEQQVFKVIQGFKAQQELEQQELEPQELKE
jgi:hypothetical protein